MSDATSGALAPTTFEFGHLADIARTEPDICAAMTPGRPTDLIFAAVAVRRRLLATALARVGAAFGLLDPGASRPGDWARLAAWTPRLPALWGNRARLLAYAPNGHESDWESCARIESIGAYWRLTNPAPADWGFHDYGVDSPVRELLDAEAVRAMADARQAVREGVADLLGRATAETGLSPTDLVAALADFDADSADEFSELLEWAPVELASAGAPRTQSPPAAAEPLTCAELLARLGDTLPHRLIGCLLTADGPGPARQNEELARQIYEIPRGAKAKPKPLLRKFRQVRCDANQWLTENSGRVLRIVTGRAAGDCRIVRAAAVPPSLRPAPPCALRASEAA